MVERIAAVRPSPAQGATATRAVPGIRSVSLLVSGLGAASVLMLSGFYVALVAAPYYVTPVF